MPVHNGRDEKRFGQSCIHSAQMPNADGRTRAERTAIRAEALNSFQSSMPLSYTDAARRHLISKARFVQIEWLYIQYLLHVKGT